MTELQKWEVPADAWAFYFKRLITTRLDEGATLQHAVRHFIEVCTSPTTSTGEKVRWAATLASVALRDACKNAAPVPLVWRKVDGEPFVLLPADSAGVVQRFHLCSLTHGYHVGILPLSVIEEFYTPEPPDGKSAINP